MKTSGKSAPQRTSGLAIAWFGVIGDRDLSQATGTCCHDDPQQALVSSGMMKMATPMVRSVAIVTLCWSAAAGAAHVRLSGGMKRCYQNRFVICEACISRF